MCRLIMMNKNGEKEIEKNYGIENFLEYLENRMGGHGNGVSLLKEGKVIFFKKGTNLSIKEISRIIRKRKYDWCIFHTRFASIGSKSDKNCHPFIIGDEVMAMNGTEMCESLLTNAKDITDTEAILNVKEKFNLEIPALMNLNSIFVGFSKGKPYVVANNAYNIKLMYKKRDNAIVFASEFPKKFQRNIYEIKEKFIWFGENIDISKFRKYRKTKQLKYWQMNFNEYFPLYNEENYEDLYDYYYQEEYEKLKRKNKEEVIRNAT